MIRLFIIYYLFTNISAGAGRACEFLALLPTSRIRKQRKYQMKQKKITRSPHIFTKPQQIFSKSKETPAISNTQADTQTKQKKK